MKTVITIGRQYGSGGREIGIRLAQKMGIPFYDKELLRKAAEKSGLCEKIFENFDERPKSLLYSIAMDSYMFSLPGTGAVDSLEQKVYLATFETIRHLAEQGGLCHHRPLRGLCPGGGPQGAAAVHRRTAAKAHRDRDGAGASARRQGQDPHHPHGQAPRLVL
jgi:hypothetical protein